MALGDVIARLSVHLGLEVASFEKGTKRAETRMSGFEKNMSRASNAVKTAFVGMLGVFAVDQIIQVAKAGLEYASSLGEVATQLGLGTKALQEYRYAASQAGISQGEMDQALGQLTRRLGDAAQGSKTILAAFDKLGVSIRDANGHVLDAGDAIPLIAEGLKGLESPAERAAVLVDLFGKSGQKLAPLLEGGAAGVNNLRNAAHELGIVLSDKQIQDADKTADKLTAMKMVLEANIASAVADNAESILALANALTKLVTAAGDAAKAWRYFSNLDWSWDITTKDISDQFAKMAVRDLGPGVELTDSVKKAISARRAATLAGPSGGPLRSVPKRAPARPASTPWGPLNTNLNRKAVGGSAFGGGFGSFDPGQGASGWMRIAQAANDTAKPVAAIDAMMTRIAMQTGVRMVANFREAAVDSEQIARSAQNIIDRLFPDEARTRQYADDLAILRLQYGGAAENASKLAEAEKRLRNEWVQNLPAIDSLRKGFEKYQRSAVQAGDAIVEKNREVSDSYGLMAQNALSALGGLIGGKAGKWINAIGQIGMAFSGAFGGSKVPGFANGTNFAPGGLAMVGERGPELVNLPRGSSVTPNNMLGGAQLVEIVDTTGLFRFRVNGQIAEAAPSIASAGASGGVSKMSRSGQRRVG